MVRQQYHCHHRKWTAVTDTRYRFAQQNAILLRREQSAPAMCYPCQEDHCPWFAPPPVCWHCLQPSHADRLNMYPHQRVGAAAQAPTPPRADLRPTSTYPLQAICSYRRSVGWETARRTASFERFPRAWPSWPDSSAGPFAWEPLRRLPPYFPIRLRVSVARAHGLQ
jgi:hypothetical protein